MAQPRSHGLVARRSWTLAGAANNHVNGARVRVLQSSRRSNKPPTVRDPAERSWSTFLDIRAMRKGGSSPAHVAQRSDTRPRTGVARNEPVVRPRRRAAPPCGICVSTWRAKPQVARLRSTTCCGCAMTSALTRTHRWSILPPAPHRARTDDIASIPTLCSAAHRSGRSRDLSAIACSCPRARRH